MPAEGYRRLRRRFDSSTPPPVVNNHTLKQLYTPRRSALFAVLDFFKKKQFHASLKDLNDVFMVPVSIASDIIKNRRVRRWGHGKDEEETRGRPRQLTRVEVNAIYTYIDRYAFEEKALT
ncbi:hypothetical protein COCVIDRAFT_113866 [Bipolaris victoriae FI3]|uniref:Uncharacterized protein n=1 Tax=Bipolaris victoriae (strain FI3) TaxID=930091 RepID=W7E342_BIPV3|nr:hypothetical protein COCVIDRAFT_113866 [Bipolaris victoriae FI3]